MADENQPQSQQDEPQVPQDSAPVDGTISTSNPHPVAEDPEDHIGDEQKDPWDDETSDWRAKDVDAPVEQNEEDNA